MPRAKRIALCAMLICLCATFSFASDIQFEATVDRTRIALGEALQLNLSIQGTQEVSAPNLDKIEGFEARYVGPSSMVSVVNGAVSSSITHIYSLFPLKTGKFTIGPFSIEVEDKTFTSKPIAIEVVAASSPGQQNLPQQSLQGSAASNADAQELKDRVFLVLSAGKRKAYLNEVIPLTVKLYVNRLRVQVSRPPELSTSDFSIDKFGQPKQYREDFGGVLYDVIEFTTSISAIKPGEFSLGPAKLNCDLMVRKQNQRGLFDDDFFDELFGRYASYPLELKSVQLPITILDFPQEGRPEGFEGALGDFQLEVEAAPLQLKAGDPVTLRMRVKGEGNFDTVKPPKLQSTDGFKVYDPQVKQVDGIKEFEQVLMPESEKITHVPEIRFSYFNTRTGQYQVLAHEPIPISVTKSDDGQIKVVEAQQAIAQSPQKEELGRDIIYIKTALGKINKAGAYLYASPGFWLIQLFALLFFAATLLFKSRQQKLKTDSRYARRLRAQTLAKKSIREVDRLLRSGKTADFFDAVYKSTREYLADRFHLPQGGITAQSIEQIAKEKNIDPAVLDKIKKLFSDCDLARYAPSEFSQQKMQEVSLILKEIIDHLERQKI